ncbi:MAG: acetate--CoA ligase [Thermoleophilia bacterium]
MLDDFFAPGTVAVIGASATPGKVGHAVMANLVEGGFKGIIVPVNPRAEEILGIKAYPHLNDYGGRIDLSVITVPQKAVREAVESSLNAGASGVIVITAGFREIGEEGARAEEELVELVRKRGARMLGPNCLGVLNTHTNLNASFAQGLPKKGNISIVSQSGALLAALLDFAAERHLGLAKMVSIGNKADVNEIDLFTALAEDDDSRVVVAYLESIASGDEFIRVAEMVADRKPLIVLKSGTSSAGVKAASSHTGSLAGADIAYGAAFRRAGVIRAESFEEIIDFATALATQPLPKGDRVAIITNAGGPGIMAADAVEHAGLSVAALDSFTATALKAKLPDAASVGNPIDVLGDADPERYRAAVEASLADESVDAIIVILTPQAMTQPAETARAISQAHDGSKPILAVFMGGRDVLPGREELVARNLPDYPDPERAVDALRAMVDYVQWKSRPKRVVTRFPVNRRRVERIISQHLRTGRYQVSEAKAKAILGAYDFHIPEGGIARSGDEAVEMAERIGFPVAMKVVSQDIVHKSDVGGVKINLGNKQAVRDAYDLMMLRIPQVAPDARIDGVYVEEMASPGLEVILGMTRDPQFGPMLMFGLGGIFVEVMKDVTFHLAPITAEEAMQMLRSTRSYALLEGARGRSGVDLSAIAGGLQRISQLVTDFPQIAELDINPFIVGEMGTEPVVADARITLGEAGEQ